MEASGSALGSLKHHVERLWTSYCRFVSSNVDSITALETLLKGGTLILTNKFSDGAWTRAFLDLLDLVCLMHDTIIRHVLLGEKQLGQGLQNCSESLKLLLTVLDYTKISLEVVAWRFYREPAKWFMVFCIEIVRFIVRTTLLLKHRSGILGTPPVKSLDRTKLIRRDQVQYSPLYQSGRQLRKLHGAPPVTERTWKQDSPQNGLTVLGQPAQLDSLQMKAELVHYSRPLVYLVSLLISGKSSMKPWVAAFAMDVSSLVLHNRGIRTLHMVDHDVLSKRSLSLLLYLMRSPFFDHYTKHRLTSVLSSVGEKVPLLGLLAQRLLLYIIELQQLYFAVW